MTVSVLQGDCRALLRTLPDESVHCVVTSPPYLGLRDYQTAKWDGGEAECDHIASAHESLSPSRSRATSSTFHGSMSTDNSKAAGKPYGRECGRCGARRIDSQIGLEPTPNAYVAEMVAVFREIRRVLRQDGTCWLNLGDSYAGPKGNTAMTGGKSDPSRGDAMFGNMGRSQKVPHGLKPKDLIGIPWRVAFALQADGWWLRQDIIWSKPNPMPESVTDRCTKAHEYLFLLTKAERYYFDAAAIAEPVTQSTIDRVSQPTLDQQAGSYRVPGKTNGPMKAVDHGLTRNKRSVWEVTTQPFSEAHFATFPPALIEPCILAGCPAKACAKCGAPWGRVIEATAPDGRRAVIEPGKRTAVGPDGNPLMGDNMIDHGTRGSFNARANAGDSGQLTLRRETIGFSPSCSCDAGTVPGTCLDPFGGAGTTGLVADRLQRNAILIELNPAYAAMAQRRIAGDAPLFAEAAE